DDALAARSRAELAVGEPKLPDDLGHREIAVESLPAGRAELAGQRAARLGGDAQSTAVGFGNEYCVDRIAFADVEQPFASSVPGQAVAHDSRGRNARGPCELFTQRFRNVAHPRKIRFAETVHPALELSRPERLLIEARDERGEPFAVHIEEIDAP